MKCRVSGLTIFGAPRSKVVNTDCIHRVDAFATLVLLSLDPVPVEVGEQAVDIIGASRVSVPLLGVVSQ